MIYEKLTEHIGKDKVLKDVPLKEHISFKVGGPCKCMVFPSSAEEISKAVEICRSEKVPYYVLGNGTNVIALDEGYKGVIIKIGKNFGNIAREGNCLKAQSGVLLSNLMLAEKSNVAPVNLIAALILICSGITILNYRKEIK